MNLKQLAFLVICITPFSLSDNLGAMKRRQSKRATKAAPRTNTPKRRKVTKATAKDAPKKVKEVEKQGFELLVKNLGRLAIPKEVLTGNIMPRVIIGLVAQENQLTEGEVGEWFKESYQEEIIGKSQAVMHNEILSILKFILFEWNGSLDDAIFDRLQNSIDAFVVAFQKVLKEHIEPDSHERLKKLLKEKVNPIENLLKQTKQVVNALDSQAKTHIIQFFKRVLDVIRCVPELEKNYKCLLGSCLHFDIKAQRKAAAVLQLDHPDAVDRNSESGLIIKNKKFFDCLEKRYANDENEWATRARNLSNGHRDYEYGRKKVNEILEIAMEYWNNLFKTFDQKDQALLQDLLGNLLALLDLDDDRPGAQTGFMSLLPTFICPEFPGFIQNLSTQLCMLAATDNTDLIDWLAACDGIDIATPEPHTGFTPLHCVRTTETVQYLVEKYSLDVNALDKDGNTPLHIACTRNDINLVQTLIEAGADMSIPNVYGNYPIHIAAYLIREDNMANSYETDLLADMRDLLADMTDRLADIGDRFPEYNEPGIPIPKLQTENTKLDCTGNSEIAQYLIATDKVNINVQNDAGNTPLHIACQQKNTKLVQTLIEAGADASIPNVDGNCPIHIAAKASKCDPQIIEMLLNVGKQPIDIRNERGETALALACGVYEGLRPCARNSINRKFEKVAKLLKAGANPNKLDKIGETPLFNACRECDEKIILLLLEHGANPHLSLGSGKSAYVFVHEQLREVRYFETEKWTKIISLFRDFAQKNDDWCFALA